MTGHIVHYGPYRHRCQSPRFSPNHGDIWRCEDCSCTWKWVGYMWIREKPWSRWLRERRQRRVEDEPMGKTGSDE